METTLALVILSVVLWHLHISAALHWRRVLYPSAFRTKRGTPALLNPSIQRSVEDANLLYEVVWSGLYVEAEKNVLRVADEELASLRRLQPLEVVCEDVLPRTLSDIRRLCHNLEQRRARMSKEDFERTVLTMVYTAERLAQSSTDHQRELWADALLQLYKRIKKDLGAE
ncbi:protein FAM180A isoform X2 [Ictalurus furcatus]|uniref:protein FAM180A isoform X2 n=1 Tax=Ictalurus furcatus TaxID=66913 RepID=UPI00234FE7BF|nr:protein FAM180A isoform X2 [Ictalurus furcatus]